MPTEEGPQAKATESPAPETAIKEKTEQREIKGGLP